MKNKKTISILFIFILFVLNINIVSAEEKNEIKTNVGTMSFGDYSQYLENEKEVALRQSSNDDWYILTREDEKSITILDSLLTSGVNTVENQIHMDSKLAKYEYLNEILSIMQIAKQTGKVVNLNQEREGEYLDFEVLIKNGTLILEDGNIKIGNEENVKRIRESLMKKIEIGKDSRIVGEEPEEKSDKDDDERL